MKRLRKILTFTLLIFITAFFSIAQAVDSADSNSVESSFVFSSDGKYLAKVTHVNNNTQVRILETEYMKIATQWQIPDFETKFLQFSPTDSGKILITDYRRVLLYKLNGNRQKLLFIQPELKNQEIIQAGFSLESDEVVWATKNTIYKSNPSNRKSRELAYVNPLKSTINSFTALENEKLAVSVKNSKNIFIYSPGDSSEPRVLRGHSSPVINILSPFGKRLYSIDHNQELLIWNPDIQKIEKRLHLGSKELKTRVKGVFLGPQRNNLIVTYQTGDRENDFRYAISDLKKGLVRPIKQLNFWRFSKNPIAAKATATDSEPQTARQIDELAESPEDIKRSYTNLKKNKKRNTIYELAKIESDNSNFEAALDFIKMVPLNDPNFKKSRELRKKIYQQIEIQNSINAARKRLQTGNLSSARVLLKNMQAQYPDDPEVNRYLDVVEGRLSKNLGIRFLIISFILLLLLFLGYLVWRYRRFIKSDLRKSPKLDPGNAENDQKVNPQRREFILLLNKVKNQLKMATHQDRKKKHLDTWLEMTAKINMIEKKAKLDDKYLPDLTVRLKALQTAIVEITNPGKAERPKTDQSGKQSKREKNRKSHGEDSSKEKPSADDATEKKTAPDYYQVLGISKTASNEEIKRAYRDKMKEYHPDKHNASDYDWVKSEASRMTKLIQEAYRALSNTKK